MNFMNRLICLLILLLASACNSNHYSITSKTEPVGFSPRFPDAPLPGLDNIQASVPHIYQDALESAGADYVPRTHHFNENGNASNVGYMWPPKRIWGREIA